MELARVIGRVVATVKHPSLEGVRLMVIQPIDTNGNPQGEAEVAVDALQSGPGDIVSWITGREAELTLPVYPAPVDCAVVSIVDHAWSDRRYLDGADLGEPT